MELTAFVQTDTSISCLVMKCYDRRCREGRYLWATFEDWPTPVVGYPSRLPNPPRTHEEATNHGEHRTPRPYRA